VEVWTPTPDEVKGLIPARARSGPFTEETTPTYADVVHVIDGVVTEVVGEVGAIPDDSLGPHDGLAQQARWAATLGAAYYVEAGFFPEQQDTNQSPADRLYGRYQAQLDRLRKAIEAHYSSERVSSGLGTIRVRSGTVADYKGDRTVRVRHPNPWDRSPVDPLCG
jgi:hypothetical protein